MIKKLTQVPKDVSALSRWKEYFFLVVPITFIAAVLGEAKLDWRLPVLFLANLSGQAFAFMINEVEDAEDDKKDKKRNLTNPVALGKMSYGLGWWLSVVVGLVSVALYSLLGPWVYVAGVVNFGLSLGYSWKKVRFKSKPVLDLVSHGLTLGGMQYLAGFLVYGGRWSLAFLLFMFVALMSVVGQLYNQIRDFDADRIAGLNNSANMVGVEWMKKLRWLVLLAAAMSGVMMFGIGAVPWYILGVGLLIGVGFKVLGVSAVRTSREKGSVLRSQKLMLDTVLAINLVVIVWLIIESGANQEVVSVARLGAGKVIEIARDLPVLARMSRLI